MQVLKLADDLFPGLLDGTKRCTIRAGRRDIKLEPLQFVPTNNTVEPVIVDVLEVRYLRSRYIDDQLAWADGANGADALRQALTRFYPDLGPDGEVTVVLFEGSEA